MQHAGLQYGQAAVNSHQSPPFAHADISQPAGGNTTSSLRQFRKKDGEKSSTTDLNAPTENSHIARVPPHNHFPARPNDYLRYQPQYPDYNTPYKEAPAQVKYSEIAETPQSLHHVDHLQKHKDQAQKEFMEMCNISQQSHMKQNYGEPLTRQQSYPPDASVHHQYLHKEPQVHPGYKPESQYQQYPQLSKYNMPSQCRKYAPPPPLPPENDFLAKLQRINPSMARSIMSDHHQTTYSMEQNRMYPQNQRYYSNNFYNYQYNYPSCNYRTNQIPAQYPTPHTDRSISPRNLQMMNYGQKVSPNYSQYNSPEYAQHYQHRRTSVPADYYQQSCRGNQYMQHQPEPNDNRGASGAIRHFLENWAEEEATTAEITPIFKENNRSNDQQVFVINPSELENVSLVPTENGQYILKTGALDNSVVRIKETTENNGERTVNVQIVETTAKSDCMIEEDKLPEAAEAPTVPYQEKPNEKDCDENTKQVQEEPQETSVIVSNEVSVIKDMPLIDEEHSKKQQQEEKDESPKEPGVEETINAILEETHITSSTRRTQRIFSVDDIIGSSSTETRRNSLQFVPQGPESDEKKEEEASKSEDCEYHSAISVEENSVIIEIGGAWVQLNINQHNGTKVLSVLPLSESLVIDVNGNYKEGRNQKEQQKDEYIEENCKEIQEELEEMEEQWENNEEIVESHDEIKEQVENHEEIEEQVGNHEVLEQCVAPEAGLQTDETLDVFQSEIVIGEESLDNDVFLDLSAEEALVKEIEEESDMVRMDEEKEKTTEHNEESIVLEKEKENSLATPQGFEEIKHTEVQNEENPQHEDVLILEVQENKKEGDKFVEEPLLKEDILVVKKSIDENIKPAKRERKSTEERVKKDKKHHISKEKKKEEHLKKDKKKNDATVKKEKKREGPPKEEIVKKEKKQKPEELKDEVARKMEDKKEESSIPNDVVLLAEEMITLKQLEENKDTEKLPTKAAKKLYVTDPLPPPSKEADFKPKNEEIKKFDSKLEETVSKLKCLKTDKDTKKAVKNVKQKKVTFDLEVREISKEEIDKKKLSLEEYNSRKRKPVVVEESPKNKIMEDTVTSTEDITDSLLSQAEITIETSFNPPSSPPKSPLLRKPLSNWEDETPSPGSPATAKDQVMSTTTNRKCIIDVNEFNIKPIESVSTPSPVSSSQFSYHSEDDSLQVYKDVVDFKLNSLNIKIPKLSKPKPVDRFSVLLDRFLNKGTLNFEELEEVKKFIEIKRKMMEEEKKTYEVRGERDYKDLKLHFRKVPQKRKKKRFRNLYTEDSSDSESSQSDKGVENYSVYQRDSQGVPKLIFKRKSGLPQPFVKLERSQAAELLAKKRKLY